VVNSILKNLNSAMMVSIVSLLFQKSFLKYKVFQITDGPCYECAEDFEDKNHLGKTDTTVQVDYFLMNPLEIKRSFFRKKAISARVSREYVDLSAQYFYGCDYSHQITWAEKKEERKNTTTLSPLKN
jgi:hypothetical protein